MARLTIYKDNNMDATLVSNRFIDEYMKDANDAQLKIYLYLLRMFHANLPTSVSDIADTFNHTEKDVIRALKYWEKNKLLMLEYDEDKNLVGIQLAELTAPNAKSARNLTLSSAPMTSMTREPVTSAAMPAATIASSTISNVIMPVASEEIPEEDIVAMPVKAQEVSPFAKPDFSRDQLKEFKSRESTSQLLFIAEQYLGRPLTPTEMKSILFFSDTLHFSDDLIDYLIQYCVDHGKKQFSYIEKVAIKWAEEGITTPKEAKKNATKFDKSVYTIMNELGKSGSPTNKEMEFINRWTKEYGFSTDIIIEACERTVLATDKHRFEYAEGILSSWKRDNVHHKSDILKMDDLHQQQKQKKTVKSNSTNKFNQIAQNNYDFDVLEKELLSN